MDYKIIIVGIGPGAPEYIVPIAKQQIDAAKVLVGSKRALETLAAADITRKIITGDIPSVISFIQEKLYKQDVVVLVSGDPGYYSLLAALRRSFPLQKLQVIPGISSMQLAFARLALPWQSARLLSLHGRKPDEQSLCFTEGAILGILTDTIYTSKTIAELLLRHNWPRTTKVYLCAKLSYENEEIIETTLENAVQTKEFSHCIMVVTA
jgi:cobalt-precorrin-7 (C5)-methyltransferase